jgi:molybdopterin biosynthesis enzyme
MRQEGASAVVELLDWQGSADLRTLAEANCLAFLPPGEKVYALGDLIDVYLV